MNTPDFEFFCYPVRAETTNDDGSPATINQCELDYADAIGVYRCNPEEIASTNWLFDITVVGDGPYQLKIAQGLCDLLNGVTPREALRNPNLHIFFE